MKNFWMCSGIALALCWISALAAPDQTKTPPKSIFGVYGPGQKRAGRGRDLIRIKARESGKVNVALKLYYANGHTCQLDLDGEWQGDHVSIAADGLDQNQGCKLEASFSQGRIHLSDQGQRCAKVYCGTRGKLDGLVLSKTRN
jgi:hypothetical protein